MKLKQELKKKSKASFLEFPCVSTEQADFKLYCFVAKAKTLWQIVKINQRDPDKDKGYQRTLSASRVKAISNFINGKNPLPNSILLALSGDSTISKDRKKIRIPNKSGAGWVIDGQHRLAGAKEADGDIELFVIAFIGINTKEQIRQFVTINREAKGVPTSLYYDLLKHLPKKSAADAAKERAADIANRLRADEDSPLFSRIVISPPEKGQLSLTNFVRKVSPLVAKKGKFNLYTLEEQVGIFNNYFKALRNIFPNEFSEKFTFFKTVGFGAIINTLSTVFDLCMKLHGGLRVEDISNILKKIDYFEFSSWDELGTGTAAETQAGEDLRQEILDIIQKSDGSGSLKLS